MAASKNYIVLFSIVISFLLIWAYKSGEESGKRDGYIQGYEDGWNYMEATLNFLREENKILVKQKLLHYKKELQIESLK